MRTLLEGVLDSFTGGCGCAARVSTCGSFVGILSARVQTPMYVNVRSVVTLGVFPCFNLAPVSFEI